MARTIVEVEEDVYSYDPPDNGAGPMWCFGSACIARVGDDVFVSGLETIPGAKPLNNCLTTLFHRDRDGWSLVWRSSERTREPSPLATSQDGRLFLSANPTVTPPDTYDGPARPCVLEFDASSPHTDPVESQPVWSEPVEIPAHTYRSLAVDRSTGSLFLTCNLNYDRAYVSFRDESGKWRPCEILTWPYGHDLETPQPLRLGYASTVLRGREAHFLAACNTWEPTKAWHKHKVDNGLTLRPDWDYVFRRVFYCHTPDVTAQPFADWVEVANVERTGGHTLSCDLYVDPQGVAHALWIETGVDKRLRDTFFPDEPIMISLNYRAIKNGRLGERRVVAEWVEGRQSPVPEWGRLQVLPDGRILVLYVTRLGEGDSAIYRNHIRQIMPEETEPLDIDLVEPATLFFFTAALRTGNAPSDVIDLLYQHPEPCRIRYARVRII